MALHFFALSSHCVSLNDTREQSMRQGVREKKSQAESPTHTVLWVRLQSDSFMSFQKSAVRPKKTNRPNVS
jgi:hypothetical protein